MGHSFVLTNTAYTMGSTTITCLFGILGITIVLGACPTGWMSYGQSCYHFAVDIENWMNARTMCKWHNSDLMVIETPEEQAWFKTQAYTFNHTDLDDGFWLGATDWTQSGTWLWEASNQAPLTGYEVWGSGQPNDRNGSEDCLAAMKYFDYLWSDEWCNWVRLQYVCERPNTAAPIVG